MNDLEKLLEVERKHKVFVKDVLNNLPPIRLRLMTEILRSFGNTETDLENLIKQEKEKTTTNS